MPRKLETDRWLFVATLALCLVGAVMVFSASARHGARAVRKRLPLSAAAAAVARLGPRRHVRHAQSSITAACGSRRFVLTYLFVVLAMLVGVFFLDKSHATHRWFRVGPASLQPSELAKLAVILYLGLVSRIAQPPAQLRRERRAAHAGSGAGPGADDGRTRGAGARPGHRARDLDHRPGHAVRRRAFREIHLARPWPLPFPRSTSRWCTSPIATSA